MKKKQYSKKKQLFSIFLPCFFFCFCKKIFSSLKYKYIDSFSDTLKKKKKSNEKKLCKICII